MRFQPRLLTTFARHLFPVFASKITVQNTFTPNIWTINNGTLRGLLYRRHGFTEVRRTDGADNEEHVPDVRMVWGSHPERLESPA